MPAVEGWFTTDDDAPHLIGGKCPVCGTIVFPPRDGACPNPDCDSDSLEPTGCRAAGRVWSYTENHYAPPPPYVAAEPFEPYALAAVELADEGIVVLGQVAKGVLRRRPAGRHGDAARARHALPRRRARVPRVRVGACAPPDGGIAVSADRDVAILGVGMHPWGKWGRDFTEYGMVAARAALDDAGLAWRDIQYVAGADTIRNGYPGFIAGATFAQKLGWTGVRVSSSYAACASGAQALHQARAQILAGFCDVALVIGADTTPKGFFAPGRRRAQERPRLAALPPARRHQPGVLRALRAPAHGRVRRDHRRLRARQGEELAARAREPERAVPQGEHGRGRAQQPGRRRSAAAARHLRDVRRRGGDDRVEHGLRAARTSARPTACRA